MTPTEFVRALHCLRWAGWLDGLAGLMMGRSAASDTSTGHELRYAQALQRMLGDLPCPVLADADADIGHRPPQMVLVNGALAEVRWSAAAGALVRQRLV